MFRYEVKWYTGMGFELPKKCKECRTTKGKKQIQNFDQ
jgi:hypothetical protein